MLDQPLGSHLVSDDDNARTAITARFAGLPVGATATAPSVRNTTASVRAARDISAALPTTVGTTTTGRSGVGAIRTATATACVTNRGGGDAVIACGSSTTVTSVFHGASTTLFTNSALTTTATASAIRTRTRLYFTLTTVIALTCRTRTASRTRPRFVSTTSTARATCTTSSSRTAASTAAYCGCLAQSLAVAAVDAR
jgi:hypothetical protein